MYREFTRRSPGYGLLVILLIVTAVVVLAVRSKTNRRRQEEEALHRRQQGLDQPSEEALRQRHLQRQQRLDEAAQEALAGTGDLLQVSNVRTHGCFKEYALGGAHAAGHPYSNRRIIDLFSPDRSHELGDVKAVSLATCQIRTESGVEEEFPYALVYRYSQSDYVFVFTVYSLRAFKDLRRRAEIDYVSSARLNPRLIVWMQSTQNMELVGFEARTSGGTLSVVVGDRGHVRGNV
jgi:hypothetical protein